MTFKNFLTELSVGTLKSYKEKAKVSFDAAGEDIHTDAKNYPKTGKPVRAKTLRTYVNRSVGMDRATDQIAAKTKDAAGFTFKDKFKRFFGGK